jgi:hypothetical protein
MSKTCESIVFALAVAAALVGCGGAQGELPVQPGPMPQKGSWDGVFQSQAYGRMEFTQNGRNVVGLYEGERHFGRIEGRIEGDVLLFDWTQWNQDLQGKLREKTGKGYFKYHVVEEQGLTSTHTAHKLEGEWGYDDSRTGNPWSAVKLSDRAKKRLEPHTEVLESGGADDYDAASGFQDVGGGGEEGGGADSPAPRPEPEPEEEEPSEDIIDDLF